MILLLAKNVITTSRDVWLLRYIPKQNAYVTQYLRMSKYRIGRPVNRSIGDGVLTYQVESYTVNIARNSC